MNRPLPTQERLHELFEYSCITGELYYKRSGHGCIAGEVAGNQQPTGYWQVGVDYSIFQTNRIIWRWVTGEDPGECEVDHINHNPDNNAWHNLQLLTPAENNKRRKCVSYICKIHNYYYVRYKKKYYGRYKTHEDAQRRVNELGL